MSPDGTVSAAAAGTGISVGPHYLLAADICAGRLVRLFPGFGLHEFAIYTQYPARKHVSSSVKVFVEFVAQEFKDARR